MCECIFIIWGNRVNIYKNVIIFNSNGKASETLYKRGEKQLKYSKRFWNYFFISICSLYCVQFQYNLGSIYDSYAINQSESDELR